MGWTRSIVRGHAVGKASQSRLPTRRLSPARPRSPQRLFSTSSWCWDRSERVIALDSHGSPHAMMRCTVMFENEHVEWLSFHSLPHGQAAAFLDSVAAHLDSCLCFWVHIDESLRLLCLAVLAWLPTHWHVAFSPQRAKVLRSGTEPRRGPAQCFFPSWRSLKSLNSSVDVLVLILSDIERRALCMYNVSGRPQGRKCLGSHLGLNGRCTCLFAIQYHTTRVHIYLACGSFFGKGSPSSSSVG